jgi:hypothetical protein
MASIRMILVIAANLNLEVEQMDVKTTFLHGELEEEIYMEHPGFFLCVLKAKKTMCAS